jgi:hypothetical protein
MSCSRSVTAFFCALAFLGQAHAGARGYRAVFVNIGDESFFESPEYTAFRDGAAPLAEDAKRCWRSRATGGESFELITRRKLPAGLTVGLAKAIWSGDRKAITAAQEILKKGTEGEAGAKTFDGMYIVLPGDSSISVMGIGTLAPVGPRNPSLKVQIRRNPSSPLETASRFDYALCKVSRPLDYQFNP